jgi:hypothetical protein
MPWPVDIDGDDYHKVPQSWIGHEHAVDHDKHAPPGAIRLYAVSVHVTESGRALRVRYLHPNRTGVLELETGACPSPDDADQRVPCALVPPVENPWPRSYVPDVTQDPDDVHRAEERDYFLELWGERLGIGAEDDQQIIADGGRAVRHLFDLEQGHLGRYPGGERR